MFANQGGTRMANSLGLAVTLFLLYLHVDASSRSSSSSARTYEWNGMGSLTFKTNREYAERIFNQQGDEEKGKQTNARFKITTTKTKATEKDVETYFRIDLTGPNGKAGGTDVKQSGVHLGKNGKPDVPTPHMQVDKFEWTAVKAVGNPPSKFKRKTGDANLAIEMTLSELKRVFDAPLDKCQSILDRLLKVRSGESTLKKLLNEMSTELKPFGKIKDVIFLGFSKPAIENCGHLKINSE